MLTTLNERLAVAGTLVYADMAEIAKRGYRTLIDLRADGEPAAGGLSPAEVRQCVTAFGIVYVQVPIVIATLDDAVVETVRRLRRETTGPVLLHCTSGRRAGAVALLHLCCDEEASIEQYLAKAQALGLDWDSLPSLREFCTGYIARCCPHTEQDLCTASSRVANSPRRSLAC